MSKKSFIDKISESLKDWKLYASLLLDALGIGFAIIPVLGDVYTTIANFLWVKLFLGMSFKYAAFAGAEELLPFTDVIPSCTIAYIIYKWSDK